MIYWIDRLKYPSWAIFIISLISTIGSFIFIMTYFPSPNCVDYLQESTCNNYCRCQWCQWCHYNESVSLCISNEDNCPNVNPISDKCVESNNLFYTMFGIMWGTMFVELIMSPFILIYCC